MKLRYHLNLCIYELVLLLIGISPGAGGILTRCWRYMYALIVALGVKIDELRHCTGGKFM
jgi:hypothetical protein